MQGCRADVLRRKSAEEGNISLVVSALLLKGLAYCWRRRQSSGAVCALAIAIVNFSGVADREGGLCRIQPSSDHVDSLFTTPQPHRICSRVSAALCTPSRVSHSAQQAERCKRHVSSTHLSLLHILLLGIGMHTPVRFPSSVPRCSLPHACISGRSPSCLGPNYCIP